MLLLLLSPPLLLLLLLSCRYVQQQIVNATGEPLSDADKAELDFAGQLSGSSTHKARLLHYFPVQQQQQQQQQPQDEDWCGWHLDHGSLTGTTQQQQQQQQQQ
jgi:hypothetical protein